MQNEKWYTTAALFFPRIIANIFNALTMDDKGYSLKKILACFGSFVGRELTIKFACAENALSFLYAWLVWIGILIGIYSIGDIASAIKVFKGTDTTNENKPAEGAVPVN